MQINERGCTLIQKQVMGVCLDTESEPTSGQSIIETGALQLYFN